MQRTRRKIKVLFLCTGNSCRSQMAEGWARRLKGDVIEPYSAGIEPHGLDPRAVKVMAEAGVDISGHRVEAYRRGHGVPFDYVVTVCDDARERCPVFPGKAQRRARRLRRPAAAGRRGKGRRRGAGRYRRVRDEIRTFVEGLLQI